MALMFGFTSKAWLWAAACVQQRQRQKKKPGKKRKRKHLGQAGREGKARLQVIF